MPEVSKVKPSNVMYFAPLNAAVKFAVVDEDVGAKVTTGDVLLLGSLWKVMVLTWLTPEYEPNVICSVYVPEATLNVTGPLTPFVARSERAAVNVV